MYEYTLEECQYWVQNPTYNPKTQRFINFNSQIYRNILKQCKNYGLDILATNNNFEIKPKPLKNNKRHIANTNNNHKVCNKKWIRLTADEAEKYSHDNIINGGPELSEMKTCKHCHNLAYLHVVHDENGDYYCVRCDKSVNLAYYCFHCLNGKLSDL